MWKRIIARMETWSCGDRRVLYRCASLYILTSAISAAGIHAAESPRRASFAIVATIPAISGVWDYARIDATAQRLYLASDGVLALDLRTGKSNPQFVSGKLTHGIVPLQNGTVAVADGSVNAVKLFDGATGKVLAEIQTGKPPAREGWHNPDALVFEPKTGMLIAVNSDSGALALIDIARLAVVGTIPVGGKLEFADVDNDGNVYVNVETRNEIAVVDVPGRKISRRIPLRGCEEPTGLAYDPQDRLVISVCSNGVAKFVHAQSGAEAASLNVGKGSDAALFDPIRRVAFFPAADDGTLSIVEVRSATDIAIVQTLKTQRGVRLGALDLQTGTLYLPAVKYDTAAPPVTLPGLPPLPRPIPSSFRFLVVARRS